MIVLLSPAKTLNFEPTPVTASSQPFALDESAELVETLRHYGVGDLQALMGVSRKLAELNHQRYQDFQRPFTRDNAKQAILAFKGDTYRDIPLEDYTDEDFAFAQKHVRILSGLYGLLRPLDLMQPYRLEMGTRLETSRGKNLYSFWGDRVTRAINRALGEQGDDLVLNCASDEYFKAVRPEVLEGRIFKLIFRDYKKGTYKVISFYAKRARGMMAHFVVKGRVNSVEALKDFEGGGYRFDPGQSTETELVYLRRL